LARRARLWRQLEAGEIAVAGQGTAALLYATDRGRFALLGVLDEMARQPWADGVLVGEALAQRGFARKAVSWRPSTWRDAPTPTASACPEALGGGRARQAGAGGSGQHGGWGPDETRPFLMVNDGRRTGVHRQPSSLVDIAPTLVSFLGLRPRVSTARA